MISSGVTQTGQPGPWIISTPSGSSWSMPCRMIEWVWPPQTSIIAQGRVVAAWIWSSSLLGQVGVAELVEVFHCSAPACRCRPARAKPSPNSSSRMPEPARSWPASPAPTPRRAAGWRSRRGRRRTRRPPRRGCTAGRPPCGRRRSRPPPSGCRRPRRCCRTRPGTARHMCSSPPLRARSARPQPTTGAGRARCRRRWAAAAGAAAR